MALQQRYEVSRSVLREAVRLVEHHQVARMRRGPNGGLLICEPDAGPATRAVVIYLEFLGTTLDNLLNARLVFEPLAAALAAENIDEAGIGRLRAVLRAEGRWQPGLPAPHDEFHIALAEQSKNPVLQLFIDVLMRLTKRYARASRTDSADEALRRPTRCAVPTPTSSPRSPLAIRHAKTLSERHVQGVTSWLQRHQGPAAGRTRAGSASNRPRLTLEAPARKTRGSAGGQYRRRHRGVRLAGRFGLRHGGCAAGTLSGESRGTAGSGAPARISRGGAHAPRPWACGLVVSEPQARASIDTIALYLQIPQAESRRPALRAGCHRNRQCRKSSRQSRRTL